MKDMCSSSIKQENERRHLLPLVEANSWCEGRVSRLSSRHASLKCFADQRERECSDAGRSIPCINHVGSWRMPATSRSNSLSEEGMRSM